MTVNANKRRQLRKARTVRVFYNGVEVTNRCFYVDGRRRVARLFVHDEYDRPCMNKAHDGIETVEIRGRVKLRRSLFSGSTS